VIVSAVAEEDDQFIPSGEYMTLVAKVSLLAVQINKDPFHAIFSGPCTRPVILLTDHVIAS
jgi:hypothetical protein